MHQLFEYSHTNLLVKVKFRASDIMLKIHSNGSFLSVSKSRSRAGGYYYFGDNIPTGQPDKLQGSMHQECSVIKPIMGLAAKYETSTLCLNCQNGIILRTIAKEIRHLQPLTLVQVDNSTTCNFVTKFL